MLAARQVNLTHSQDIGAVSERGDTGGIAVSRRHN
jgi:hypothetical protein